MEFRARKCNYEQMRPVILIDGRRMEMISATSISGKGKANPKGFEGI